VKKTPKHQHIIDGFKHVSRQLRDDNRHDDANEMDEVIQLAEAGKTQEAQDKFWLMHKVRTGK